MLFFGLEGLWRSASHLFSLINSRSHFYFISQIGRFSQCSLNLHSVLIPVSLLLSDIFLTLVFYNSHPSHIGILLRALLRLFFYMFKLYFLCILKSLSTSPSITSNTPVMVECLIISLDIFIDFIVVYSLWKQTHV